MLRRAAILLGACIFFAGMSSTYAQTEYDAYLRVDGIDSFDGISDTPILLPTSGTYTADVVLRDSMGGLLSEAFANDGAGIQSTNVEIGITGGSSSGSGFTSTNPTTVGSLGFFFNASEDRPGGGLIRDGSGNVIAGQNQGNPASMVGPGIFEAVIGTFEFNFDASEVATISTAWGGDNTGGFFNGVQADGRGGSNISNLDQPRPGLINFRTATITAVPEPGSFLALGAGTIGVLLRRRRR